MHVYELRTIILSYIFSGRRGVKETLKKTRTNFSCDAFPAFPTTRALPWPVSTVMTKFILVSGGVVSGIGKGVIGMRMQPHHHSPHV